MAIILDGKKISEEIIQSMKSEVQVLRERHSRTPLLVCVQLGRNLSSKLYVRAQGRVAEELGIDYRLLELPDNIQKSDLANEIGKLNKDLGVHAIIIQTPLPDGVDFNEVVSLVSPFKDAEGIHPQNLGKIISGKNTVEPCTPAACMELLRYHKIELYGKEAVVVGHSGIVGKPLSIMLLNKFATTTVCHIATSEANKLEGHVKRADILVVAVGKPNLIKGSWIKKGAVVIDVGITYNGDRIIGDVEFEEAEKSAYAITPVPGGVGPLTVTMLMRNCFELFKQQVGACK